MFLCVLVQPRAPCGTVPWQLGLRWYLYASLIQCVLRTRYVQLLSGFVGTVGWSCWTCFTIVEMSCKPGLIGSSREKVYPSLTVRAYDGLSWDTPAGYYLSKAVPAVMRQMGIC